MNQNENINSQNTDNNVQSPTNNQTLVNETIKDPTPISEVRVEESSVQQDIQPRQPAKNNKVSTILVILLFIFLFAFIMGMPYINDFINNLKSESGLSEIEKQAKNEEKKQQQENNKNNQSTNQEEKLAELICTLSENSNTNYQLNTTQKFNYNKTNQVINSSITSEYLFTTTDNTYLELKNKCDQDSLKYINREGYTMACSYSDKTIEISDTFELETFKTIIDGTTTIKANATYKQDIATIKSDLTSQGYTCK